jgi:hypothetical protein
MIDKTDFIVLIYFLNITTLAFKIKIVQVLLMKSYIILMILIIIQQFPFLFIYGSH